MIQYKNQVELHLNFKFKMAKAERMLTPRRANGAYGGFRTDFAVTRHVMLFSVLTTIQKISKTLKGRYKEKHCTNRKTVNYSERIWVHFAHCM